MFFIVHNFGKGIFNVGGVHDMDGEMSRFDADRLMNSLDLISGDTTDARSR